MRREDKPIAMKVLEKVHCKVFLVATAAEKWPVIGEKLQPNPVRLFSQAALDIDLSKDT